ncbi:hypothetical protein K7J14_02240 [Treponema zuelzerae]|uniref:Uncharacterized protein n=1 Tax=Teretinema zuelzerae TaxID=156 RepID=A0AAE3JHB3_9SPIR|nr:hypothetical protein [Teretinema zuelzerae]MCD1653517.1 hypothetical protein [Teretinema zuelzerae]
MISQNEANYQLNIDKQRVDENIVQFPLKGSKVSVKIESFDKKLYFNLDVNNTPSTNSKITYQTRNLESVILVRLDINSAHRNPIVDNPPLPQFLPYNGMLIKGTHIHFYVENFFDSWAIPIEDMRFSNGDYELLNYFYKISSIIKPPIFEYGFAI